MKTTREELMALRGKKTFNRLSFYSKSKIISISKKFSIKNNESIFLILNNLNEPVVCKNCDNFCSLVRGPLRYREYCSVKCKNSFIMNNTDIKERISESVKKYACTIKGTIKDKQIKQKLKTQEENGSIIPTSSKSDFERYKSLVDKFTNKSLINKLENIEKRGRADLVEDYYHLDHKFSKKQGFLNCIPPYIIGSIYNLEMIKGSINASKQADCSISLSDLVGLYYE